jgi:hypothetical protein
MYIAQDKKEKPVNNSYFSLFRRLIIAQGHKFCTLKYHFKWLMKREEIPVDTLSDIHWRILVSVLWRMRTYFSSCFFFKPKNKKNKKINSGITCGKKHDWKSKP